MKRILILPDSIGGVYVNAIKNKNTPSFEICNHNYLIFIYIYSGILFSNYYSNFNIFNIYNFKVYINNNIWFNDIYI